MKLNASQLSKLKTKFLDEYKGLDIIQLLDKIKNKIPNLYKKIYDIKYDIEIKNKKIKKSNRLIFFGSEENIDLLNQLNTEEIFLILHLKLFPLNLDLINYL